LTLLTAFLSQTLLPFAVFILQEGAEGQSTTPAPAGGDGANAVQPAPQLFPPQMMLFMLGMGAIAYFMLIRPKQQEDRRRKELLGGLKKNDKVVTIGGMIGTVVEVAADGKRVTLRVDDNTRVKFLRESIRGIFEENSDSQSSKS